MPKPTDAQIAEEDERTTARGLARYAHEYIEAALVVDEKLGAKNEYVHISPIPAYFLASHGIELTLKAFLRTKGVSAADLRTKQYGHDLRACYRESKRYGLLDVFRMCSMDMRALLLLVEMNEFQGLRYIRTGPKTFASWAIVEPFAVRLHQAVAPLAGWHSFNISYPAYQ